jgi:hypothetical protein
VVEFAYQEGFTFDGEAYPGRIQYRTGLDLGYAQPLGRSFALTAGVGTRAAWFERAAAGDRYWGYDPILYGGVSWESADALNVFARLEVHGNLAYRERGQVFAGVTVPLVRLGGE